jgi:hypothetical protein
MRTCSGSLRRRAGALPESELTALPPEDNAELRLAERIQEAADEYQRKMSGVH